MVAKEYAKALHEIAEELNILDIIKNQYKITLDLLKDQEMMSFFTNPVIKSNEKKDLIKKSFSDFNENFVYFLYVLIDNNRFNFINDIYEKFIDIYLNKNDMISIKLFSAEKLKENDINRIIELLRPRFNNKKIVYENIVDSSLIGGIKVLANDTLINLNTKTSIDDLKNSL